MSRAEALAWFDARGLTYTIDKPNGVIIIMDRNGKFLDSLPLNKVDVANWVVNNP